MKKKSIMVLIYPALSGTISQSLAFKKALHRYICGINMRANKKFEIIVEKPAVGLSSHVLYIKMELLCKDTISSSECLKKLSYLQVHRLSSRFSNGLIGCVTLDSCGLFTHVFSNF